MKAGKSRRRTVGSPPDGPPSDPAVDVAVLPPDRAFLLQLTDGTGPPARIFAGRLWHLSSGSRLRFVTWDDFQAAVATLLGGPD